MSQLCVGRIMRAAAMAVVGIFMLSLAACSGENSGGEQSASASTAAATVDPRFASAEALLQYCNQITTTDPVNPAAQIELVYAENELQQQLLRFMRSVIPITDLDRRMFEKFREGWIPGNTKPMTAPDKPAVMISNDSSRAQAEYQNDKGEPQTLQLVKIGDRWWVSGYTYEYDPKMSEMLPNLDAMERLINSIIPYVPSAIADIEAGRLTSAQQVRIKIMSQAINTDPTLLEAIKQLGMQ